jgi:transketolase N-terminal domain/subunit
MSIQALERQSALMRCDIIQMIQQAGQGHPGGSLSAADILAALYFRVIRRGPTGRIGIALCSPRAMPVRRCMLL